MILLNRLIRFARRRRLTGSASAFSPSAISGLALWLKSDAGLYQSSGGAAAVADNDPVGEWQDQSGAGAHVANATGDNRPVLKLAVQNGRSVVRFDGTNDELTKAASGISGTSFTIFVVLKSDNTGGSTRGILNVGAASGGREWRLGTTAKAELLKAQVASMASGNTADDFTAFRLRAMTYDGATVVFRLNGASDGGGSSSQTFSDGQVSVGSGSTFDFWDGDIGELLYYSSVLTSPQIDQVEAYLNGRWGVY